MKSWKRVSVSNGEVSIVSLRGVLGHVKITGDDPGGIVRGLMLGEILEELGFLHPRTGA
jgi:hypothetical protein